MIKDRIENIGLYKDLSANMGNAVSCLQEKDFLERLAKQERIEGNGYYVMLQEYMTKPEENGRWETHKKYIDIQYVLSGEERTGYTNLENLGELQEANPERDFYFYEDTDIADWLTVHSGEFVIFFPTDGHKPSLNVGNAAKAVRKVVFKVEV